MNKYFFPKENKVIEAETIEDATLLLNNTKDVKPNKNTIQVRNKKH